MATPNAMHMANSFDPSRPVNLNQGDSELLARRTRVLGAPYRLFYERPLHLVRGEGVTLFDAEGREYLDAYNNVPVVGHSNPRVRAAVDQQLGLLNTHTRYLTDAVVNYAERLTSLFDIPGAQAVFVCTGSEAVDLSLRMARHATGRRGIIATRHAYHGTTEASAAISPSLGANNVIPDDVELIDAPNLAVEEQATAAEAFALRVTDAVNALRARGLEPAALIVDSIMSSDGLQGTVEDLLGPAAAAIRSAGGLYIADEVQPGFGRTGAWWGYPKLGVEPDLVVLGKPMGNGIPIAGVIGRPEVFDKFGRDVRYFNTFGGNPVSIAAATAVLDEIEDRGLLTNATAVGGQLLSDLRDVVAGDPSVGAIRGSGLFLALELVSPESGEADPVRASAVVNHLREAGVLISASGIEANVLKVRPPLVFGPEHAPRLVESLANALVDTRRMAEQR